MEPIETCKCDIPYQGTHVTGTPNNCERCGKLIPGPHWIHGWVPSDLIYTPPEDKPFFWSQP